MTKATQNPEVKALIASYAQLLISDKWTARRQLSALHSLENLAARCVAIGAAGAHVSHDRLVEASTYELCTGIVAAVDPRLVDQYPDVDPAEAMQNLILQALDGLGHLGEVA